MKCWQLDEQQLISIDSAGRVKSGWPLNLPDGWWWWSPLAPRLASDGTLFLSAISNGGDGPSLWAIAPDGSSRPGWPISVPNLRGYDLGVAGSVVISSYVPDPDAGLGSSALRTIFSVLGPDGRTLSGWPRGSKGFAAGPVVAADGTIYYISQRGNVYAHDRTGEVKAGWPVPAPGVFPCCGEYGPYLGPEGTVYVLGDEVIALSSDGTGWRYRPTGQLRWPCLDAGADTDCLSLPPALAFGPDGAVYIAVFHADPAGVWAEVVALDRQGHVTPGWPYRLTIDPITPRAPLLTVSPDGRLYVAVGNVLLALSPDGRVSH